MAIRGCPSDCISSFTDDILHHIMSFLPKKDAFRMCVLSKNWKNVVDTYPKLDFSWLDFGEKQQVIGLRTGDLTRESNPKLWEILEKLIDHVDGSMSRFSEHEFSLQRFKLFIQLPDLNFASVLDKWVLLALEKGVKEVNLSVELPGLDLPDAVYSLPKTIFAARSVHVLNLFGCQLEESLCTKCHSLKKLALRNVCIHELVVRQIVTCCPLLEDLSFIECCGLKNVQICGLLRLKNFKIAGSLYVPVNVEIASPRLERAHFMFNLIEGRCSVQLGSSQHLKNLVITGAVITGQLLQHLDSKFPVLYCLAIRGCLTTKWMKISSRSLEWLVVGFCDDIVDVEIDTPKLHRGYFYGSVIPCTIVNAPLGRWRIDFVLKNSINFRWYMKLKEFLAKLNHVVYLHIYIRATEVLLNVEDLSIINASPSSIEVLALTVDLEYPLSNFAVFMDGLFWCYHPVNLFLRSAYNHKLYVKHLSESIKRGYQSCCNHDHGNVKCWTKDLEGVKFESFKEDAETKFPHNERIMDGFPEECSHAWCRMFWF